MGAVPFVKREAQVRRTNDRYHGGRIGAWRYVMLVEEKRACASCGSENAPDAGFCWRCLVPFAQVPPPPGVFSTRPGLTVPPAPVPWSPPSQEPTKHTRSSKVAGAIVSLVAAVAGYFGVQYLMGPNLSLPGALAGTERLSDPESQRFEQYTAEEGDRYGIDAEGGVYGAPLAPEFFVILVDAAAVETTDELFDALVLGFSQAGAVVDEADAKSGTRQGSDYRCVEAVAGTEKAVACMWRDDDNVGIVLEMPGDLQGTRRLLWTVHDTVVS